jgi:hypothetical protein
MHCDVYQDWSRERDAVEQAMTLLLKSAPGASLEDRRVLQIQFSALVERRDAAMRRLLQLPFPIRRSAAAQRNREGVAEQLLSVIYTPEGVNEWCEELGALRTSGGVDQQRGELADFQTAEGAAERNADSTAFDRLIYTISDFSEDTINFDFLQDISRRLQRDERMLASSVSAHFLPLWRVRFCPTSQVLPFRPPSIPEPDSNQRTCGQ